MRPKSRFTGDESGVAAIEFALLGLPFFLTIFALIEVGLVFAAELTLDNAVDRVGRELRTGGIQMQNPSPQEFAELICDRVSFLFDCTELKIDLAVYNEYGNVSLGMPAVPRFELGSGGQIMALHVQYEWPIITHILRAGVAGSNGEHLVSSIAAFQTEAF